MASLHVIEKESELSDKTRDLYIDLVKKVVANTIYENTESREVGGDWPTTAHTMIGIKRLDNIHNCLKYIIKNNIPGDCVETGVWRGGATILMRAILKAYNIKDRAVWVCDSFEGLPPPNEELYPADKGLNLSKEVIPYLAVSLPQVQENFSRYGLLDKQVKFLKGFFRDTLPTAPIQEIALLRLDGDLYESTMDALVHLYPKLSIGGFVIIDDYSIDACVQAVQDYRKLHKIKSPLIEIDWTGRYWQKKK